MIPVATSIPADHWLDNGDGTVWWVLMPIDRVQLAAKEADIDRPCDTCDSGDLRPAGWLYIRGEGWQLCPDCDGTGRHTFTVEVERPIPMLNANPDRPDITSNEIRTYRVSVVPGTVLPIFDLDGSDGNNEANIMWDDVDGSFLYYPAGWYDDRDLGEQTVTLPSAAAPGMWAVKLAVQS